MTIDYSIVLLVVGLLYALLKQFLPDFPLSDVAFQALVLYLLAKIGVDVVGKPLAIKVRSLLHRKPVTYK